MANCTNHLVKPKKFFGELYTPYFWNEFWSRVDIKGLDDCWNWKRGKSSGGYGQMRHMYSHRLSYQFMYEDPESLFVCHSCDNRLCCNPRHLFLGTSRDNHDDMVSKNRQNGGSMPGDENPNSKLTEADVIEIRKLRNEDKLPLMEISQRFSISRSLVSQISHRTIWSHVR